MKTHTIFDHADDGDSPIYVGLRYLILVASQMDAIRQSSKIAYIEKGETLFGWLNELKIFYDLTESRMNLKDKEIDFFEYKMINNKMEKTNIKINATDKYDKWFSEIEKMIERNNIIEITDRTNIYISAKYINDKKIIYELSKCTRQIYKDANAKHLIMPEGLPNMKEMVKAEWMDRPKIKNLYGDKKQK